MSGSVIKFIQMDHLNVQGVPVLKIHHFAVAYYTTILVTIWLLTVRHGQIYHGIKNGKPSISIRVIYSMAMLNNQRVYPTNIPMIFPYKTI